MKRIGLLSDTHGWLDPSVVNFFENCDEVWHCGDFGSVEVADELAEKFNLKGVYGNCDDYDIRLMFKEIEIFTCERVKVFMTHIGGYPDHYYLSIAKQLLIERPKLFVCGHSHITKVIYDKKLECLHINPGAAGKYGIQIIRTAVRFVIDGDRIKDLEIWEKEMPSRHGYM